MARLIPALLAFAVSVATLLPALAQTAGFVETFDGTPPAPLPYSSPNNWDIFSQGFDSNASALGRTIAQHGPNCQGPGWPYTATNSHLMTSSADTVFICSSHVMTSLGDTGYGAVYMTPPAVLDFSNGSAALTWEMSTLRTSARDWVDIVITPWAQHSQLAYNNNDQHIPPDNLHVTMAGTNVWLAYQRVNGSLTYNGGQGDQQINGDGSTTWDAVLARRGANSSPAARSTYEIRTDGTRFSMCMISELLPQGGVFCWINTNLPRPLDPAIWHGQATVTLNHRTYNAPKACAEVNTDAERAAALLRCPPNTWHWDNITLQPYVPFQIIPSVPPDARQSSGRQVWTFAQPAPQGAHLAFFYAGETSTLRVSYDGGATFHSPRIQPQSAPGTENAEYIADPIPAGVQQAVITTQNGFWGSLSIQDARIYGPPGGVVLPTRVPTATPLPPTATLPPVPTSTPIPIPTLVPFEPTAAPTAPVIPTLVPTAVNPVSSPTPVVPPPPDESAPCEIVVVVAGVEVGRLPCT